MCSIVDIYYRPPFPIAHLQGPQPGQTRTFCFLFHDRSHSLPCHGQLFHFFCGRWRCYFHFFSKSYGNTWKWWQQLCIFKYCRHRKSVSIMACMNWCMCYILYAKDGVCGIWTMRFKGMKCTSSEWCKHNRHWLVDILISITDSTLFPRPNQVCCSLLLMTQLFGNELDTTMYVDCGPWRSRAWSVPVLSAVKSTDTDWLTS